MNLSCVSRELHPRKTFRISRARRTEVRNVFVCLEHRGVRGYGEASPNAFYGETWEAVMTRLESARAWLGMLQISGPADIEAAWRDSWQFLAPSRAAQCALDLALWDWLARTRGETVSDLLWHAPPRPVRTFATIGLSTAEELPDKIAEVRGFPCVKIKSDAAADLTALRAVRAATTALLAVDANCAWAGQDLAALADQLAALRVGFLEQPLPPERDAELFPLAVPLLADESCVTEQDVARVVGHFDGFNIKLVKCGGLTPARRMVRQGRARGKTIMVGCMLESSALIAAGAALAQQTDHADLDGAWLLADDPFRGWHFDRGILLPPNAAGLDAEPEAGLFT